MGYNILVKKTRQKRGKKSPPRAKGTPGSGGFLNTVIFLEVSAD